MTTRFYQIIRLILAGLTLLAFLTFVLWQYPSLVNSAGETAAAIPRKLDQMRFESAHQTFEKSPEEGVKEYESLLEKHSDSLRGDYNYAYKIEISQRLIDYYVQQGQTEKALLIAQAWLKEKDDFVPAQIALLKILSVMPDKEKEFSELAKNLITTYSEIFEVFEPVSNLACQKQDFELLTLSLSAISAGTSARQPGPWEVFFHGGKGFNGKRKILVNSKFADSNIVAVHHFDKVPKFLRIDLPATVQGILTPKFLIEAQGKQTHLQVEERHNLVSLWGGEFITSSDPFMMLSQVPKQFANKPGNLVISVDPIWWPKEVIKNIRDSCPNFLKYQPHDPEIAGIHKSLLQGYADLKSKLALHIARFEIFYTEQGNTPDFSTKFSFAHDAKIAEFGKTKIIIPVKKTASWVRIDFPAAFQNRSLNDLKIQLKQGGQLELLDKNKLLFFDITQIEDGLKITGSDPYLYFSLSNSKELESIELEFQ